MTRTSSVHNPRSRHPLSPLAVRNVIITDARRCRRIKLHLTFDSDPIAWVISNNSCSSYLLSV